jgi:hypothetical protein
VGFFYSCTDKEPLEQEKMIRIYAELLLAQDSSLSALNFKPGKAAIQDSVKRAIFRKYNVSPKSYEETIQYYNENQERWVDFFRNTIVYLDSLKKQSPE